MKNINTSYISDPLIAQPFTGPSLNFLQKGNKEMIHVICRNIIANHGLTYNTNTPYFMSNYDTTFTSDGAVFFNGELYIMLENTASLPYAVISTIPDPVADPIFFTDSVPRNVCNNRYLDFSASATGSLFALANIVNALSPNGVQVAPTLLNSWTSFTTPLYSKVGNIVTLQGIAQNLTGSTNTIFTLPTGYQPFVDKRISCTVIQSSGTIYAANYLKVDTFGNVGIDNSNTLDTLISFDGLSFVI